MDTKNLVARFLAAGLFAAAGAAQAAIAAISPAAFSSRATLVDYGQEPTYASFNGAVIGGVTHNFFLDGALSTDAVISQGPDMEFIQNVDIDGNSGGVLSLTFPRLQNRLGFGWAVSLPDPGPGGSVELFDARDQSLGLFSFAGAPIPFDRGGYVAIASDIPFLRAEIDWAVAGQRFVFDNLRFERARGQVPEPGTLALLALAVLGLGRRRP